MTRRVIYKGSVAQRVEQEAVNFPDTGANPVGASTIYSRTCGSRLDSYGIGLPNRNKARCNSRLPHQFMKTNLNKDKEICSYFTTGADELVFWSFRYFLGRMTISACCFADSLSRVWDLLSEKTKALIEKELEAAFKQDEKDRKDKSPHKTLGHDCDREAWEKIRAKYRKS